MLDAAGLIALEHRLGVSAVDVVLTRGEGVWLTDIEGAALSRLPRPIRRSIGAIAIPRIPAAPVEQTGRLTLTSRALPQRPARPVLRGAGADAQPQGPLLMNSGARRSRPRSRRCANGAMR